MDPYPLFIGLWPIYNKALSLLSWAFIRMYLEIFNPLSQTWAYNVFIIFGLFILYSSFHHLFFFFLEIALQLEYFVGFFSMSMINYHHFGPKHATKRPKIQGSLYQFVSDLGKFGSSFSKQFFPLGPMIAIRLWFYEPFKLRYRDLEMSLLYVRTSFLLSHNILGYTITLGSSFPFSYLLFVFQDQVNT